MKNKEICIRGTVANFMESGLNNEGKCMRR